MQILENNEVKILVSEDYNYRFNKMTGHFARWGKTLEEDPFYGEFGPEIADIEIVQGDCLGNCPFCYKCNGQVPYHYMNLDTYKQLLAKFPKTLTQIAFGITDIDAHINKGNF